MWEQTCHQPVWLNSVRCLVLSCRGSCPMSAWIWGTTPPPPCARWTTPTACETPSRPVRPPAARSPAATSSGAFCCLLSSCSPGAESPAAQRPFRAAAHAAPPATTPSPGSSCAVQLGQGPPHTPPAMNTSITVRGQAPLLNNGLLLLRHTTTHDLVCASGAGGRGVRLLSAACWARPAPLHT